MAQVAAATMGAGVRLMQHERASLGPPVGAIPSPEPMCGPDSPRRPKAILTLQAPQNLYLLGIEFVAREHPSIACQAIRSNANYPDPALGPAIQ